MCVCVCVCVCVFWCVIPVTGSQSLLARVAGLLRIHVLNSSASSIFHVPFLLNLGFPLFLSSGDEVIIRLGHLQCLIHVHTILTCYLPFFSKLFVLFPFSSNYFISYF
jgi:hypothetical protein